MVHETSVASFMYQKVLRQIRNGNSPERSNWSPQQLQVTSRIDADSTGPADSLWTGSIPVRQRSWSPFSRERTQCSVVSRMALRSLFVVVDQPLAGIPARTARMSQWSPQNRPTVVR